MIRLTPTGAAAAGILAVLALAWAATGAAWAQTAEPCGSGGRWCVPGAAPAPGPAPGRRNAQAEVLGMIPNPPGCRRVRLSCACRLAAYWGLGAGLDKVTTWVARFPRAAGPAPGVAVITLRRRRADHVAGIIGGAPGAWRVADFNSGGGLNRLRVVRGFAGKILVDTRARVSTN